MHLEETLEYPIVVWKINCYRCEVGIRSNLSEMHASGLERKRCMCANFTFSLIMYPNRPLGRAVRVRSAGDRPGGQVSASTRPRNLHMSSLLVTISMIRTYLELNVALGP